MRGLFIPKSKCLTEQKKQTKKFGSYERSKIRELIQEVLNEFEFYSS